MKINKEDTRSFTGTEDEHKDKVQVDILDEFRKTLAKAGDSLPSKFLLMYFPKLNTKEKQNF